MRSASSGLVVLFLFFGVCVVGGGSGGGGVVTNSNKIAAVGPKVAKRNEVARGTDRKAAGRGGLMKAARSQPKRQICQAISIAIIPYYGKAQPLCYPTIETGSARGNSMTHKVVVLLAAEEPL